MPRYRRPAGVPTTQQCADVTEMYRCFERACELLVEGMPVVVDATEVDPEVVLAMFATFDISKIQLACTLLERASMYCSLLLASGDTFIVDERDMDLLLWRERLDVTVLGVHHTLRAGERLMAERGAA